MQQELRRVMRNYATGVCVVTTYADGPLGRRHDAVTVNSFTSMSLTPPLVSLALRQDSRFLADLMESGVWAVSILGAGAELTARSFAQDRDARADAVLSLTATPGTATGALILDAPAWLECRFRDHLAVGTHMLVIGEVVAGGTKDEHPPLIFLQGEFHTLEGVRT